MIRNKERYAPGGDFYGEISTQFGVQAADAVYQASLTDDVTQLNRALSKARTSQRQNVPYDQVDSIFPEDDRGTAEIFWDQITTDPLSAPLDAANKQLKNAVWDVLKNPFVLLALAAFIFFSLGGWGRLQRRVSNG